MNDTSAAPQGDYDVWRRLLGGEKDIAVHETDPQCGFWRAAMLNALPIPIAIYRDSDGAKKCIIGTITGATRVEPIEAAQKHWAWCGAITEEVYRAVAQNGQPWPDVDPSVAAAIANRLAIGGNAPPEATDPLEAIKQQVEHLRTGVARYDKIEDDVTLNAAQSLRATFLKLAREADELRTTVKAPHLAKCQEIDRTYNAVVKDAQALAGAVKRPMDAWETIKLARRREQERIERERAEAEARRQAEEAERARQADVTLSTAAQGDMPYTPALPSAPPVAPAAEPPRPAAPIKGGVGRGASSRPVLVVKEVTDWPALFDHFQNDEDVRALLLKKAGIAVKNGIAVPGVTTDEVAKVN